MERHGTSPICLSAKETRVSDDLIYQTTAKELRMSTNSFETKETRRGHFKLEMSSLQWQKRQRSDKGQRDPRRSTMLSIVAQTTRP